MPFFWRKNNILENVAASVVLLWYYQWGANSEHHHQLGGTNSCGLAWCDLCQLHLDGVAVSDAALEPSVRGANILAWLNMAVRSDHGCPLVIRLLWVGHGRVPCLPTVLTHPCRRNFTNIVHGCSHTTVQVYSLYNTVYRYIWWDFDERTLWVSTHIEPRSHIIIYSASFS